jgi:hypothetical protein
MERWKILGVLMSTAAVTLGAMACAATNGTRFDGNDGTDSDGAGGDGATSGSATSGSATGGGGEGGGDIFGDGGITAGSGGSSPGDDCSAEAKLIYVIGLDNELYSFNPATLDVKLVGVINCPTGGFATTFSMAVDRKGIAWVLFSDGKIYNVNTKDASCVATAYAPNQNGFNTFGMAFVSDAPGSAEETLFVAGYGGNNGLAQIDTKTLTLTPVGAYDTLDGSAELTGTGDAQLFGFFALNPVVIAGIDKTNAKIVSQAPQPPTISVAGGWAFAFWGGDFWLFTSPTGLSQIDRYRPSDGSTMMVKTGIGTNIVGAGVSTCAPVKPPN